MTGKLNPQQTEIVNQNDNVLVTACPGSGKTRVLTHRIIRGLSELKSTKHRVVALTFTNRAAEEIQARLDKNELPLDYLWAGTIHAFALEWILRPYACYIDRLKTGFNIADEYYSEELINTLKRKHKVYLYTEINTKFGRDGTISFNSEDERAIIGEYHEHLVEKKLVDYDLILYLAYQLISSNQEIALTLGSIIRLICIDEYQDTQDLQYGILSHIVKNSGGLTQIFIVGDPDQAIYASLGGVAKKFKEIKEEFGVKNLIPLNLTGNYRSTQRIINYYLNFQNNEIPITSRTDYANEDGLITFSNQECHKDDIPVVIANLIDLHIKNGVPEHEICVLAPQWRMITSLGRRLVTLLPNVKFDAPGLSPFTRRGDNIYNIWFKIARLFLTEPEPNMYLTRLRWARDIVYELEQITGREIAEEYRTPRKILRLRNSIHSVKVDGILYLEEVFQELLDQLGIGLAAHPPLFEANNIFFEKAKSRLAEKEYNVPCDVENLKRMFRRPNGVVVNSCHGIKGEEYETVICFGLLKGYIPHWKVIMSKNGNGDHEARKMLYVIASRAKKNLHLIAECGRMNTKKNYVYETTLQLKNVRFQYNNNL